jgi:hypothetical protein
MIRLLPIIPLLLAVSCFSQTLTANVQTALSRLNGLNAQVRVVPCAARQQICLTSRTKADVIRQYITEYPEQFRRQAPFLSRWYHNSSESYRVISHPSLHLSWSPDLGLWEAHMDEWCPRLAHPSSVFKHVFLEILPHIVLRSSTSQVAIARSLTEGNVAHAATHSAGQRDGWETALHPTAPRPVYPTQAAFA